MKIELKSARINFNRRDVKEVLEDAFKMDLDEVST